jgi:outer membrane protein TolC
VRLALAMRLDLRAAEGRVADTQRKVYVAADALRGELTLLGSAQVGDRRTTAASAGEDDAALRFDRGAYSGLLNVNLPLKRAAERAAYRASLVDLERSVRALQDLEDRVKIEVRDGLRERRAALEGLRIQRQAAALAGKRVRSTDLLLQAGRAEVRDLLESQEALLGAQNALAAAVVAYRISELALQRDLGVLEVSREGLWKEYAPGEQAR